MPVLVVDQCLTSRLGTSIERQSLGSDCHIIRVADVRSGLELLSSEGMHPSLIVVPDFQSDSEHDDFFSEAASRWPNAARVTSVGGCDPVRVARNLISGAIDTVTMHPASDEALRVLVAQRNAILEHRHHRKAKSVDADQVAELLALQEVLLSAEIRAALVATLAPDGRRRKAMRGARTFAHAPGKLVLEISAARRRLLALTSPKRSLRSDLRGSVSACLEAFAATEEVRSDCKVVTKSTGVDFFGSDEQTVCQVMVDVGRTILAAADSTGPRAFLISVELHDGEVRISIQFEGALRDSLVEPVQLFDPLQLQQLPTLGFSICGFMLHEVGGHLSFRPGSNPGIIVDLSVPCVAGADSDRPVTA